MNNRVERAREVLKAGGFFRKALETQYRGGEKFEMRLRDAAGAVLKGFGYKTFSALEPELVSKPCPRSSVWATEYVLRCAS